MPENYYPFSKRNEGNSGRKFANVNSRSEKRAAYNLGIIGSEAAKTPLYRSNRLAHLDAYYENTVYDRLTNWEEANRLSCEGQYVPIRDRKPRIVINFAKVFATRVASKLVGDDTFPRLAIEDDPETEELVRLLLQMTSLKARLAEPMRRLVVAGSSFIRFSAKVSEEGAAAIQIEDYCSKFCYPQFDELGDLLALRVQYVYEDPADLDEKGAPRRKWYRLDLGRDTDVLYDNPIYSDSAEPIFSVVESTAHNLGYVQGEWFRTAEDKHSPDGFSLIEDSLSLIDESNYSVSQSSQAIGYNQEPQTIIKGMDSEEIDGLIRSSSKAWNLGRDGEASFLESDLGAVKTAMEARDKSRLTFQDLTRIILHDPEKMNGSALSGRAMAIMNAPFVDLIKELRPLVEKGLISLVLKMLFTVLKLTQEGADFGLQLPPTFKIQSLNISAKWPPVFALTMEDLKEKLSVGLMASNANIISRETITRWVAKDFGIEDIEEEIAKIASQPIINPFGAF
jgi:hypothetical protein